MKFNNMAIIRRSQKVTSHSEHLDVINNIYNNTWNREITVRIFGIPIYKSNRALDVKDVILNKEGKPFGFIKPKQST